jgi:hypothetical protein
MYTKLWQQNNKQTKVRVGTFADARLQILGLLLVRDRVASQFVERANALFDGGELIDPFVEEREHLPAEALLVHLRDARVDLSVGVCARPPRMKWIYKSPRVGRAWRTRKWVRKRGMVMHVDQKKGGRRRIEKSEAVTRIRTDKAAH